MKAKDILLGLVVIVIWGLNFIAIKVGLQDVPPLLLGALRFFFATFPVIFFLPRPPVAWRWLIALGLSINVGQFAFLFLGMKLGMPAGLASLVLQAQAFFTLAVAVLLLHERWLWHHILGLVIAAAGMSVIGAQQGGSMTAIGFWLTICAAASWGTGNVVMRRATQGVPPFSILSLIVWAGAVAILPLALLSWFIEGPSAWQAAFLHPSLNSAASILYLSYLATLVGYGLWGKLLARYPAGVVAPFALLVPVVGLSSSALLLQEHLSIWQCVGALLVMSGLVMHVFGQRWFKPAA
ncbi:EamA family transporter [Azotosporobacter soli]|uniref:EamA family transporter n=1 Tax=Azotosporobacter soli TaxID=3055040 RepID=UPI0031FE720C